MIILTISDLEHYRIIRVVVIILYTLTPPSRIYRQVILNLYIRISHKAYQQLLTNYIYILTLVSG